MTKKPKYKRGDTIRIKDWLSIEQSDTNRSMAYIFYQKLLKLNPDRFFTIQMPVYINFRTDHFYFIEEIDGSIQEEWIEECICQKVLEENGIAPGAHLLACPYSGYIDNNIIKNRFEILDIR